MSSVDSCSFATLKTEELRLHEQSKTGLHSESRGLVSANYFSSMIATNVWNNSLM